MRRFVSSVRMVVATMTVAASSASMAQAQFPFEVTVDPAEAAVVTTDVHNFVKAHHRLASEADTLAVLQEDYLDRGSRDSARTSGGTISRPNGSRRPFANIPRRMRPCRRTSR